MFLSSCLFFPPLSHLSVIRSVASDMGEHSYPGSPSHPAQQMAVTSAYSAADGKDHLMAPSHVQTQSLDRGYRPASSSSAPPGRQTIGRVQTSHGQPVTDPALNGPRPLQAKDYRSGLFFFVVFLASLNTTISCVNLCNIKFFFFFIQFSFAFL